MSKQTKSVEEQPAISDFFTMPGISKKGKLTRIPVDKLRPQAEFGDEIKAGNVRLEEELDIQPIVTSIMDRGYDPTSALHGEVIDGKGHVGLERGNRRAKAVQYIKANKPKDYERLFPDDCLPVFIYTGLTDRERILLRADHAAVMQQKPLSDWGRIETARQMYAIGATAEREIAIALGLLKPEFDEEGKQRPMKKRVASTRAFVVAARLPANILDHVRLYCVGEAKGKPVTQRDTPFRWSDLTGILGPAMEVDKSNGVFDLTEPDSATQSAWRTILEREEAAASDAPKPTALKPNKASELAANLVKPEVANSKLAGKLLHAVTSQPMKGVTYDAVAVAREIAEAENAMLKLAVYRIVLGPKQFAMLDKDAAAWIERHKANLTEAIASHVEPAAKGQQRKQVASK